MIRAVDWTPERTRALAVRIALASAFGWGYITFPDGTKVSIDYARHVLACLEEVQADSVSEREA